MRLRVCHETTFRFAEPAQRAMHASKLWPRSHAGQIVTAWRIDVTRNCHLEPFEDPFGNLCQNFSIDGPIGDFTVMATGEVLTEDMAGVVRGLSERLPAELYLRPTALTEADPAILALAEAAAGAGDRLSVLHSLCGLVAERVADPAAGAPGDGEARSAGAALAAGEGSPADRGHVFVAAARHLGVPARCVSGYLWDEAGEPAAGAHAWAEALVPGIGWIGFDPSFSICPTDRYVRLAAGLDQLGAAPLRSVAIGGRLGGTEVSIRVDRLSDA